MRKSWHPAGDSSGGLFGTYPRVAFVVAGGVIVGVWYLLYQIVQSEGFLSLGLRPSTWPSWVLTIPLSVVLIAAAELVLHTKRKPVQWQRPWFAGVFFVMAGMCAWTWWVSGTTWESEPAFYFLVMGGVLFGVGMFLLVASRVEAVIGRYQWLEWPLLGAFVFCMVAFFSVSMGMLRFHETPEWFSAVRLLRWVAFGAGPFLVLAMLERFTGVVSSGSARDFGMVSEATRNDFPSLAWAQVVGTGESIGQNQDRMLRFVMPIMALAGAALGYYFGGWSWEGLLIGAFVGGWFGSLAPRDAAVPDFRLPIQGSAGAPPTPRPLTDQERQQLTQPVTRREDCEAFLEESGDALYFCVACGDKSKGVLPVVERVPWDSFINFEESSHKQWFRARGVASDMLDWGVIIAQSNTGRIVRVAESVHDHAGLIELLVKLQNTFVTGREVRLKVFRDAVKARSNVIGSGSPSGNPAQDVPVKPF